MLIVIHARASFDLSHTSQPRIWEQMFERQNLAPKVWNLKENFYLKIYSLKVDLWTIADAPWA